MKTKLSVIFFLAMLALSVPGDSTNRLHFSVTGFSIAPLEEPPSEGRMAIIMALSATHKFAANVNVVIQPRSDTIDDYLASTLKSFKDSGITVIEQKKAGKSCVVFEYTGELRGQNIPLHWYARAQKSGGSVYLATATATVQDWPNQSAQLKACVDSLRCDASAD